MKKVLGILFVAAVAVACSKKETANTESNVMMEEPAAKVDSAAVTKPADQTTAVKTTDTAATKMAEDHASGNTNAANSTGSSGGTPQGAEQKGTPPADPTKK